MTPSTHISGLDLSRYRDRELPPSRMGECETHLQGCETCRMRLEDASALGRLLMDRLLSAEELPSNFAASVMAKLPADPPSRGLAAILERLLPPRRELALGLIGLAVAASLAIVFAPSLRSQGDHLEETTENEAEIHSLDVTSPDRSAIVFDSAGGNTVIWMVPSADDGGGQSAPSQPPPGESDQR